MKELAKNLRCKIASREMIIGKGQLTSPPPGKEVSTNATTMAKTRKNSKQTTQQRQQNTNKYNWEKVTKPGFVRLGQKKNAQDHHHHPSNNTATASSSKASSNSKTSSTKTTTTTSNKTTRVMHYCSGCNVSMHCSKEHKKYIWQEGHKRVCGTPPFCVPGIEEEQLCRKILGKEEEEEKNTFFFDDYGSFNVDENESINDNDDDDDDSSWESLNSGDEYEEEVGMISSSVAAAAAVHCKSNTEMIYKFFNENSYKIQRSETPPFANFYS
eukprot:15338082-Ditylum_brightwellii.AAC.1